MIKINAERKIIENLTPKIFSSLGVDQIAYVKPLISDDGINFGVYAADGQMVTAFDEKTEAEDFIKLNKMISITVH